MKKLLIGLLVGVILSVPAQVIAGKIRYANKIYNFDTENASVSVFDDSGNKCYVANRDMRWANEWGSASVSISCVKK